ncbi:putative abieta-7,13-dien-18-ol hydroxylase [Helianthus annuus]|nr:putative abieta-7,13-dien-18-ol hydroxylase [Helianthus annuus]
MRNHVTNVVEFANGVSEESREKMQNLHADFNGTIMQNLHAVPVDESFRWKQYHQTPDLYALRGDDVSIGYDVKKGDTIPYQPYAIGRVKFDACEPQRWFHHIVASSRKLL